MAPTPTSMHPTPKNVLLVDDEVGTLELTATLLTAQGFAVSLAASVAETRKRLEGESFDAVVSDVMFKGQSEGARIQAMVREIQPQAVIVLMTGFPQIDGAVAAIKEGAVDYLQKPVDPALLGATIHRALRERDLREQQDEFTFQNMVDILSDLVSQTIERVDPYTAGHGERTRNYCRTIAGGMGLDRVTTERLELAAIAHDYGKIYLDDLGFLTKKGPLTSAEYREVQRHPEVGASKLGDHRELQDVCRFVAEHHERWDGAGYPLRLKGKEISTAGRILGVVEVFDSLTTKRSYKDPWDLDKTIDFFESQAGTAFEPQVVDTFLRQLETHGDEWLKAPQQDLKAAGIMTHQEG